MHLYLVQEACAGSAQSYAFIRYDRANALEIKLCKIH